MSATRRLAGTVFPVSVLAALALSACSTNGDSGGGLLGPDITARTEISDAARNNGAAGFYFVSPIAPNLSSYPGVFDAARTPVVEVCEFVGGTCVGSPVARFTVGSGVTVDAANQLYRADWTTIGLPTTTLYRIRVLEGTNQLGYADAKRVGPGESATSLRARGIVPLGNASRLPIRFRIEQNGTPTVVITSPANSAIVPVGTPVTISATATDPQEGDVSNQIVYRSSRLLDPLGTGPSIAVILPGGRQTISASVTDAMGATTTVSVEIVVSIVSVQPTLNVPYTGSASLPITLSEPAPAGGVVFNVTTTDATRVGVDPSSTTVTIPAGQQAANAVLLGVAPGSATVTVSNADFGSASSLVSTTANLDIVQTAVSFPQGQTAQITVRLRSGGADVAAPAGGLSVTLTSADAGCASATSPVVIPAGLVNAVATVSYGSVTATPCSTTLTASATSVPSVTTDDVPVNVASAAAITFSSNLRVGAGLRDRVSFSLAAPAPAGGVTVTLTSSNSGVLTLSPDVTGAIGTTVATVVVPQGSSSGTFYLNGIEGQINTTATVTAAAPGYSNGTASVAVAPIVFEVVGLPATTTSLSPNTDFRVRIGVGTAAGIQDFQEVRAGSPGVLFTAANSNGTVGQLVTNVGGAAQSRTVTVPAGAFESPTTVAGGGIAFDPLGVGSTTVTTTTSSAGAVALPSATTVVTVTGPGITFGANLRVGAGLRDRVSFVLGAPAPPGGLSVTLTSSNSGVLTLSPDVTGTVGTPVATVVVPQGSSSGTFYLNGIEGQISSATVSASAPGFGSSSATVSVLPIVFEVVGLPATTTTLSPNTDFRVRVGVGSVAVIQDFQEVRAGSPGVLFTVANSNGTVAQLVTTAGGAAQSRTVTVPAGAFESPSTAAGGGIAFDPLGAGSTTVTTTTTSAGAIARPSASTVVSVTGPGITFGANLRVGAGLRDRVAFTLGAPAPDGGLSVTLTSSNGAVLTLSPDVTSAIGTPVATVVVPQGSTSGTFYLNGIEGQINTTATVTASAPGFGSGSATVSVAPIVFEVVGIPATTTTLSPNSDFRVRIGVGTAAGIQDFQEVRAGSPGVLFTVTNSNGAVAQLVTNVVGGTGQSRTVTVPAGALQSATTVAGGGIAFDPLGAGSTTVTTSTTSVGAIALPSATTAVTVTGPGITFGTNLRVGAGLRDRVSFSLGAPAPAGGLSVTLTSSNSGVLTLSPDVTGAIGTPVATVVVPQGSTSGTFYLNGIEGQNGNSVTITAAAAGFNNGTATVAVAPIVFEVVGIQATTTTLSPNTDFRVRIGVGTAAGIQDFQEVRAGSSGVMFTVANSNGTVAQLVTTAGGTAQSHTVTVPAGALESPTTVAGGGIAFDPLGAGTTIVTTTTSVAGAIARPSASSVVNVIVPVVTVNTTAPVGSGLRRTATFTLGAPAPTGGLTVTLSSSNSSAITVSPISNTIAGAAMTTVVVPQGGSSGTFYLNGLEGLSSGTSTITVAAPGYANVTSTAAVSPLAFDISSLPATAVATGPNITFVVRVGAQTSTGLLELQGVRVGSSGIGFTVANSNATVAQLVTTAGVGQSRAVTVPVGSTTSETSPGAGGIAFDPLAAGTTTVSASTSFAGAVAQPGATRAVTVSP